MDRKSFIKNLLGAAIAVTTPVKLLSEISTQELPAITPSIELLNVPFRVFDILVTNTGQQLYVASIDEVGKARLVDICDPGRPLTVDVDNPPYIWRLGSALQESKPM